MNYWWVNHKQTFEQEVSGGYQSVCLANGIRGTVSIYASVFRVTKLTYMLTVFSHSGSYL